MGKFIRGMLQLLAAIMLVGIGVMVLMVMGGRISKCRMRVVPEDSDMLKYPSGSLLYIPEAELEAEESGKREKEVLEIRRLQGEEETENAVLVVPYVGSVLLFLESEAGKKILALYVLILVLIIMALVYLREKDAREEDSWAYQWRNA